MRKTFFALATLLFIAGLLSPNFIGSAAEELYRTKVEEFSVPGIIEIKVLSYERDWFKATAQVQIKPVLPNAEELDPELAKLTTLLIQDTIYHGPVTAFIGDFATRRAPFFSLAVVDSALFFDEEPMLYELLFGQAPLFISRTVATGADSFEATLHGQPMSADSAPLQLTLDWKGFNAEASLEGKLLTYSARGEGLEAHADYAALGLLPWREEAQLTLGDNGIYTGEVNGTVEGAWVNINGEEMLKVGALGYEKSSREEEGLIDGEARYRLAESTFSGLSYGPAALDVEIKRVDAVAITNLATSIGELAAAEARGEPALGDEGLAQLYGLLTSGPELTVSRLEFTTPDGDTRGTASSGFNADGLPENPDAQEISRRATSAWDFDMPTNLAVKLAALSTAVRQQALDQLLAQNPDAFPSAEELNELSARLAWAVLQSFAGQGLIEMGEERLRMHGSLKEGVLTVGQQAIPMGGQ